MKQVRVYKEVRKDRCNTIGCRNAPVGKFCGSCRSRMSRLKDPIRYAYNNLKNRAKQRGKEFSLTPDQFKEFCVKSQYIQGKGTSMESYTLDRIRNEHGYHIWNLQVMKKGDNIKKFYLKYDWMNRVAVVWKPDDLTPIAGTTNVNLPQAAGNFL